MVKNVQLVPNYDRWAGFGCHSAAVSGRVIVLEPKKVPMQTGNEDFIFAYNKKPRFLRGNVVCLSR
jgi:hypothetical protein